MNFPSIPPKELALGILTTDSSFTLLDILSWDGVNNLSSADFFSTGFGCFKNTAGTEVEFFTFDPTTVANSAINFITRGNDYKGGTADGVKTKYNWSANETVVLLGTDAPALFKQLVNLTDNQTIAGLWTFSQTPIGLNPGAVQDASTTVKGITELSASPNVTLGTCTISIASPGVVTFNSHGLIAGDSVQFTTTGTLPAGITASTNYYVISTGLTTNAFEIAAGFGGSAITTTGSQSGTQTLIKVTPIALSPNDTRIPTALEVVALAGNNTDVTVGSGNKVVTQTGLIHGAEKYATTTGSANAYVVTLSPIPTSLTPGMTLTLIANFTNTGASTLAVNSLGSTPAITKNGTSPLVSGDIKINQVFTVTWDGTEWQLVSPSPNLLSGFIPFYQRLVLTSSDGAPDTMQAVSPIGGIGPSVPGYSINLFKNGSSGGERPQVQIINFDPTTGSLQPGASQNQTTAFTGIGALRTAYGAATTTSIFTAAYSNSTCQIGKVDIGTLANQAAVTVSGTAPNAGNYDHPMFSDGTNLYVSDGATIAQLNKYSVSGSTITFVSSITFTGFVNAATWCDGTNVYQSDGTTLRKWALTGGAATSTRTTNQGFANGLFGLVNNSNILLSYNNISSTLSDVIPITKL